MSQTVFKCPKIPNFAIKSQRSRYEHFSWMIWAAIRFHFRALYTYCMSTAVLFVSYLYILWNEILLRTPLCLLSYWRATSERYHVPLGEKLDRNVTDQQRLVTLKPWMILRYHSLHKIIICVCVLCPWVTLQTSLERRTWENIKRGVLMRLMGWARECVKERAYQSLLLQRNIVESKIWDH